MDEVRDKKESLKKLIRELHKGENPEKINPDFALAKSASRAPLLAFCP